MRANKFATWQTCEKCGLRLSYTAKPGRSGDHRSVGPLPQHVSQAQTELSQTYTAAEMNHKIFLGKLLEIKGRVMVQTCGGATPNIDIKAKSMQAWPHRRRALWRPPRRTQRWFPRRSRWPRQRVLRGMSAPVVIVDEEETPQLDGSWEISGSS